ncbi:MAG TPA: hypothetical protein VMT34_10415, partial [Aggregatilineales bacterium]|nr:hypothetical protein [Aggregatilineales bacterium]
EALLDYARAIQLDGKVAEMYAERAATHMTLHNVKAALEDMNQAIRLDPNTAAYYNRRGVLRQELRDFRGAAADFQAAGQHDPNFDEPRLFDALARRL